MSNQTSFNKTIKCFISLDFEPQPVSSLPQTIPAIWIAVSSINGLTAPLILGINLLVIWTVLEDERLRNTTYNILLATLAFTDLLMGLIVQPTSVALNICLLLECSSSCPLTIAYMFSSLVCCGWSLATLTVLSVERYLAIEHQFFYSSKVTVPKVLGATAITWGIMTLTLVGFRLMSDSSFEIRQLPVAVNISICCLIILNCVGKVYHTSRRQRAIIADITAVSTQQDIDKTKKMLKELKCYFVFGLVIISTVILYLPSLVTKIIGVSMGQEFTPEFKYIGQFIWVTCVYLQSLANPLIISLRLSYIRKGVFKKLFRQDG
ncbi:trace amine-associated receptor 7h-like [Exaiptasia diaphana]|uniref:G-protein coupled receptors family 1 profile domain-containing protein n=1 Tax=Exaiptasia diaphana TaxID=2652724 RepID=A0A913Y1Q6_EXADI|nr:trace amine-associated receptor 7h-like [Exaiptasia diaphana]